MSSLYLHTSQEADAEADIVTLPAVTSVTLAVMTGAALSMVSSVTVSDALIATTETLPTDVLHGHAQARTTPVFEPSSSWSILTVFSFRSLVFTPLF